MNNIDTDTILSISHNIDTLGGDWWSFFSASEHVEQKLALQNLKTVLEYGGVRIKNMNAHHFTKGRLAAAILDVWCMRAKVASSKPPYSIHR